MLQLSIWNILLKCFFDYMLKSEGSKQERFNTDLSFSFYDDILCNVELKLHLIKYETKQGFYLSARCEEMEMY